MEANNFRAPQEFSQSSQSDKDSLKAQESALVSTGGQAASSSPVPDQTESCKEGLCAIVWKPHRIAAA